MGFGDFLKKTTAYVGATTAVVTALPVLGAAGAITATGAAIATGIGVVAAASEEF